MTAGSAGRSPGPNPLSGVIAEIAHDLPADAIEEVAAALDALPSSATPRRRASITRIAVQPDARAAVARLVVAWHDHGADLPPAAVALALRAAARADERRRDEQTVELVWSGPTQPGTTSRRTEQVLLDLIEGAKESLILVTYAAYKVPRIVDALRAALDRGVRVTLILESPEKTQALKAFKALVGDANTARAGRAAPAVYVWPLEKRPKDARGNPAALHAKCAIADDRVLFISSANLTESAMEGNMEFGVFLRGAGVVGAAAAVWRSLAARRVLGQG